MYASKSIESVYFVPATTVVPRKWDGWFWQQISDNAPFSWGDNDHTLVNVEDFARHCEERLDPEPRITRWLKKVRSIPKDVYIDLET